MPNHVTNELRILNQSKEKQVEIFKALLNEQGHFSFKKILPMPESLSITSGSTTEEFVEILKGNIPRWLKHHNPEISTVEDACDILKERYGERYEGYLDEGRKALENEEKYGHQTWYTWCNEKWGTKWDAYEQPEEGYDPEEIDCIRFETAWSTPVGIFEALAKKFEGVVFEVKFADEDTGSNCGTFTFEHTGVLSEDCAPSWSQLDEDGQRKWRKFAFELSNPDSDPKEWGFDSNWDYIDNEDEVVSVDIDTNEDSEHLELENDKIESDDVEED